MHKDYKKEKKEHTQTHTPTTNYTERNEKQGIEERRNYITISKGKELERKREKSCLPSKIGSLSIWCVFVYD